MLVQVIEWASDGVLTVTWDTDKVRAIGIYENDDGETMDATKFADSLETEDYGDSTRLGAQCSDFSSSYGGLNGCEEEPPSPFDKQYMFYLD